MKISVVGLTVPEGKVKYQDKKMDTLVEKFAPDKVTPFFVEFRPDNLVSADAIVVLRERLLDVLIQDMEKFETRLQNSTDDTEKRLVKKCLGYLEQETPLCDATFDDQEQTLLRVLAPVSLKPTLVETQAQPDVNGLIQRVLEKARTIFFYTAGKKEVHAWQFKAGADVVACAGKINSDLARGFIKADIVNCRDFFTVHNMQEARAKGFTKLVDREYVVEDGDILEIRFSV